MAKRLVVIDGADEGRYFPLSDAGTVSIGSNRRTADICLHDLYVSRIHCEIKVDGDQVEVTCLESRPAIFINGKEITQEKLQLGDVLRVGNSHLRLQIDDGSDPQEAETEEEAAPEAPAVLPHLPADRLEELAHHTLGHFKLSTLIGKGHHGAVFRARDVKADRDVALKVLSPDFPKNDEEMQRFIKGLKVMLPLRHPHVVSLLGAGKTGPYTWIAMELLEAESLTQVLARVATIRKIDWRRAFHVAVHIGRALEFAHRHHIIHRNITAQNILWLGTEKVAKLGDLILAKALEGSLVRQVALRDKIQAELAFLAPEQTHSTGFVDGLTDIYSLGVAVYALLTGKLPFEGATQAELVAQIRDALPLKPKKYQPAIPDPLERVVLKMLAKHQVERYQTATELLADLQEFGEAEGVTV